IASAAAVSLRSTAPWFPRAIPKTRGTSQWPSVGRAAAPPFALRGPRRHGHKTSQLQFSRYSPSIRHASGIVVSSPRPRGAGSVRGRDCRCAPARVSTASVTVLASSRDGPHPRRALPDDRAAAGARGARRGRARARGGPPLAGSPGGAGARARDTAARGPVLSGGEGRGSRRRLPQRPARGRGARRSGTGPGPGLGRARRRRAPRRRRGPRGRPRARGLHDGAARGRHRGRARRGDRGRGAGGPPHGVGVGARATLIYLLRHGEVVHAETRRFIGHLDVPLSERGERQSRVQATRLADAELTAVFTSDLARARRTAEIIAAPHGLTPTVIPALREIAMGRWDGRTAEEIRGSEPAAFADWMARVGEFPFPEGESVPDLRARAWPAFEAIIGAHAGESVAIVAHGGTNRALLCTALGLELRRLLALGQDYGALSVLARVAAGWRLVRLNELPML